MRLLCFQAKLDIFVDQEESSKHHENKFSFFFSFSLDDFACDVCGVCYVCCDVVVYVFAE
jgi:hypothetical protein